MAWEHQTPGSLALRGPILLTADANVQTTRTLIDTADSKGRD
ncbi:MAG: hypothetical protein RL280_1090 [Actinomycetota bacterium]